MSDSSTQLHEPAELLTPETIDRHRALVSIIEEFDAIDWYQQRIEAADDPELAKLLAHNRNEEHEHAVMTLEWLRRRDKNLDKMMRLYLFTDKPILSLEESETSDGDSSGDGAPRSAPTDGSLGIGSLRDV